MPEKEDNGTQDADKNADADTSADANPDTAEVEAAFLLLMKWLHRQPSFWPESMREPEVQEFVRKTAEVLNRAVDVSLEEIPLVDISVQRLKESNYVFSGIKTFHELNEAFPLLTDGEGNLKPFEHFLNDVQKVNENYNRHYLSAEYHFARASAQMAAKWQSFLKDPDAGRYLLQYRTAADERVRKSHRLLHNITLPITSRFWDWYFPPNGWRCRCNVVQVRRGKYPETGEQEAMNLGSQATAGKHQEMFRFNPGKQMATFPAYNAYTIGKCQDCKENGTLKLAAKIPDNELCAACRVVREMSRERYDTVAPPQADTYKEEVEGKVYVSPYHGENEVEENSKYARLITGFLQKKVYLLPRLDPNNPEEKALRASLLPEGVYEGKNPDFLIGGELYDGKSMLGLAPDSNVQKQKQAIENHIKKAKKQAANVILDIPPFVSEKVIANAVNNYLGRSKAVKRVIVLQGDKVTDYKKK